MPLYQAQAASNTPIFSLFPMDPAPVQILNGTEALVAGASSIAVAIAPLTVSGGPGEFITFLFQCPLGIGAGVLQIQESDLYDAAGNNFTSVGFGNPIAFPGVVNAAAFNTTGSTSCKVTLQLRTRYVRVYCQTAPTNPVSCYVSR
jgi:hypothetical protein